MALAVDPVFGRELVAVDADHAGWPRRDARVGLRGERACEQAQGGGEEEGVLRHRIGPASAWRFRVSATGRNAGVDDATTTQSAPARTAPKFSALQHGDSPRKRGQRDRHGHHGIHISSDASFLNKLLRSEEHTSELKSLLRISYAVFCLKKKKYKNRLTRITI